MILLVFWLKNILPPIHTKSKSIQLHRPRPRLHTDGEAGCGSGAAVARQQLVSSQRMLPSECGTPLGCGV